MKKHIFSIVSVVCMSSMALATGLANIGTSQAIVEGQNDLGVINIQGNAAKAIYMSLKVPLRGYPEDDIAYPKRSGPGIYCEKRIDKRMALQSKNMNDVETDYECSIHIKLSTGESVSSQ